MVAKKAAAKKADKANYEPPTITTIEPDDGVQDEAQAIAERVAPDAPHDGRFHKRFVLPPTSRIAEDNWADADGAEQLHNANKVDVLELALHRGLHPQGDVAFDGEDTLADGSVALDYSVEVREADKVVAAETHTPSSELNDLGGTTVTED